MERSVVAPAPRRRGKAAWTLLLLAPVCGELTFSAVGMPIMWLVFPVLIPMYGAGVLLVRELVVRAGGGWPSVIVMGLVYELAEDGFGLQALTSTTMYNADEWGLRLLGFNATYWETQAGYHIVFSVMIPIVITDLLFPELKRRSYLRRRGLVGISLTALAGLALARVTFSATEDPGYRAPIGFSIGLVIVMVILSFVALRVLPGRLPRSGPLTRASGTHRTPAVIVVGPVAGVATLVFLCLLFPRGNPPEGPALGDGALVYLSMTAAATVAVAVSILIHRWSRSSDWTDRHQIWLVGGALIGHTAAMVLMVLIDPSGTLTTIAAVTTGTLVIIVTAALLTRLSGRVRGPARHDVTTPATISGHE
ncbi:hypothetical protein [Nocardia flavorosea]|uniref:Uncharacterized protein n=1 Tax=Nocardia flavorosea TaxID=53429 RepID=A0A846YNB6_9NOCA|nr:hypothetical protein [Nocardia flavorosea]NKY59044.1 hypothetical protein [Nocardia flavorosea]